MLSAHSEYWVRARARASPVEAVYLCVVGYSAPRMTTRKLQDLIIIATVPCFIVGAFWLADELVPTGGLALLIVFASLTANVLGGMTLLVRARPRHADGSAVRA
jgi:hypothetical protein